MHKGVILLVKAEDADEAESLVQEFLEPYGNSHVWDWYVIGGRWDKRLNPSGNIIPLSSCIDVVKEWMKDNTKEAEMFWDKMVEAKETDNLFLAAYYAGKFNDAVYDNFSFESNVYDVNDETNDVIRTILNPEGVWAVMVDMHN
jgi:hypothetical protein